MGRPRTDTERPACPTQACIDFHAANADPEDAPNWFGAAAPPEAAFVDVILYGRKNDVQRYKCKRCGHTFTLMGTVASPDNPTRSADYEYEWGPRMSETRNRAQGVALEFHGAVHVPGLRRILPIWLLVDYARHRSVRKLADTYDVSKPTIRNWLRKLAQDPAASMYVLSQENFGLSAKDREFLSNEMQRLRWTP
jgi:hypothetical protein